MYSSLDRVDIVGEDEQKACRLFVQTDHRSAEEIAGELSLSVLFALSRVLNTERIRSDDEPAPTVRYAMMQHPPQVFREVLASAGAQLEVIGEIVAFEGQPTHSPTELATSHFASLAQEVLARKGLTLSVESFEILEQELFDMRDSLDVEEDEITYWTRVIEFAAVTGELLKQQLHTGEWIRDEMDMSLVPFAFQGREGRIYNVIGKVERFIREGVSQRPMQLIDMAQEDPNIASEVMVSLKASSWARDNDVLQRELLGNAAELEIDVPVITYGEDRPQTFSTFKASPDRVAELDELHAKAMVNLAAIEVKVEVFDIGELKMAVVSGNYFASEKILDESFMLEMQANFESPMLLVGVPRKGSLFVCSGIQDPELVQHFIAIIIGEYNNQDREGAQLSALPLLVSEGKVTGFVQLNFSDD